MGLNLSYEKSGVNIDVADSTKQAMAKSLETDNKRVLNKLGAFASLYDFDFPKIKNPVLVLKTEEPGSKQKLAYQYDKYESIGFDMINHLVNDIMVMGATPLTVQDAIICNKIVKEEVNRIVNGVSEACKANECVLTGGETSEQPGIVSEGIYILTSSVVGIVDKDKVIDGSKIKEGDIVLAIPSNGVHTNGYSLLRMLMKEKPEIINQMVGQETFIETILKPHKGYYKEFKGILQLEGLNGMAHITGGGIKGNLNRVLPDNLNAIIDISKIKILEIFKFVREIGGVSDEDMIKTFNLGVGLTIVISPNVVDDVRNHLGQFGTDCYEIGTIVKGQKEVEYTGNLTW